MKRPYKHAARCPGPESEQVTHQETALQQANYIKGTVLHAYLYASSEGQAGWNGRLLSAVFVSGFYG